MFAKVTLLTPPFTTLDYLLPEYFPQDFWQIGQRVAVPLAGKNRLSHRCGFISSLVANEKIRFDITYKHITWPLEESPVLKTDLIELSSSLAARYAQPAGSIFGHILPLGLRSTRICMRWQSQGQTGQKSFAEIMLLSQQEKQNLATLLLSGQARIFEAGYDQASMELCCLKVDPPWKIRPGAKRQAAILDLLHANGSMSRKQIIKTLGSDAASALKTLIQNQFVGIDLGDNKTEEITIDPPTDFEKIIFNADQNQCIDELVKDMRSPTAACRLLHGVTGSGKTAVYMEVIRACLNDGKSALLLAPEVALAHKLFNDAAAALPHARRVLYHGYQSAPKREKIFRSIAATNEPHIIIGTRSALFLPIAQIGCLILDEEHDASFKQDENFAYHAREVAWHRINLSGGLLLLGSATPDIRTFYAASSGKLALSRLPRRVSGREMPPMHLVDLGQCVHMPGSLGSAADNSGILAPESEAELQACITRGEQAVIMLNRRGYAPMIYCTHCSKILKCPQCEIGLAYHKNINKLLCHYCGYSRPYPSPCQDCGKLSFLPLGDGTERLEERLSVIAGTPVLRLDRDNIRRQGKIDEILASFSKQESPFLVGTQMLSKGHHFPNVTLVIIADGDIGLNLPDYRAAERTFQLLVQSAGRAGRGDKQGKVLIQTRDPKHYCWNYVCNYDYEGFYAAELAKRKRHIYPPFTNLALLRVSFPQNLRQGYELINDLAGALKQMARETGVTMLGPAPAPIALLRGRKRFHCLFKASRWDAIRNLYLFANSRNKNREIRVFLDLDPVNML